MNKINNYNPNFTGRFVIKGKISPQNKALLDKFINHTKDGISNCKDTHGLITCHRWFDNFGQNKIKKTTLMF